MAESQGVWEPDSHDIDVQKCKSFKQWEKNVNGALHRKYEVKLTVSIVDADSGETLAHFVDDYGDNKKEITQTLSAGTGSANQAITLGQSVLSFENQVQFYNGLRLARKANEDAHAILKLKREADDRKLHTARLARTHGYVSEEDAAAIAKVAAEKEELANFRLKQAEEEIKTLKQAEEIRLLKEQLAAQQQGGLGGVIRSTGALLQEGLDRAVKRKRGDDSEIEAPSRA
ncbi:hypothetical protein CYMTET_4183 [Cymbomonas tetramitiformis]|uniref:Uncharacterized protein n=1 Tax=Cymbomonas tetramitiformis TaxID=36881 RepID=A0AAE0H1V1_9CHLO|nr:hypothetical protein CYMTET_4183 [Cymbomonas tetramitiformis]|eukprot:gene14743-17420_t